MKKNKQKSRDSEKEWHPTTKRWVKAANMWVKTSWKDGKRIQEWSIDEPKLQIMYNIGMNDLKGRLISEVKVAEDKGFIDFVADGIRRRYKAEGDCCAHASLFC